MDVTEQLIEDKKLDFKKKFYANRFNELFIEIHSEKPEIIDEALEYVEKYYRNNNASLTPRAVCAASMYIACVNNGMSITQTRMAMFFGSNSVSMRRAFKYLLEEQEAKRVKILNMSNYWREKLRGNADNKKKVRKLIENRVQKSALKGWKNRGDEK